MPLTDLPVVENLLGRPLTPAEQTTVTEATADIDASVLHFRPRWKDTKDPNAQRARLTSIANTLVFLLLTGGPVLIDDAYLDDQYRRATVNAWAFTRG